MFQKFAPTLLFDGYRFREPGSVLITDGSGRIENILPAEDAGDDVQAIQGIICPGFVNAHCHLELSHMNGVIERHTGLPDFLLRVMRDRGQAPRNIEQAMADADSAMYKEGIVAVGDICNTTQSLNVKKTSSLFYYNFVETMGVIAERARDRFAQAKKVWEGFSNEKDARFIGTSIVPHAPYSVSHQLFDLIAAFPHNKVVSIHMLEAPGETELLNTGEGPFRHFFDQAGLPVQDLLEHGKRNTCNSSLQTMLPFQDTNNIFVHNVEADNNDINLALEHFHADSLFWCLCPQANLYISRKLPGINLFLKRDLQMVLGTDSLASNDRLSILSEINCIREHFPGVPLEKILQWATINGAKALHIADRIGSFEAGKTPGVVWIADSWDDSRRIL